ncbi:MAG: fibronectin type III domain-containing protein, partial [Thermoplasmata archaeon]
GNFWYDNTAQEGNRWSNWDGKDWGTANAYPIDGGAGASDWYPLSIPPSVPQNLVAIPGNGNVTLKWQPPANNGGSPITGYKVYWGTATGNYTNSVTVGNVRNYTVTGLTNGQTYYFIVSAINAAGESAKSYEVSATPQQPTQPGAPAEWLFLIIGLIGLLLIGIIIYFVVGKKKQSMMRFPKLKVPNLVVPITQRTAVASSKRPCPHCKTQNPITAKFCQNCGARLVAPSKMLCPRCKTQNPPTATFCQKCGAKLR